jgi:hypothetical protein
LIDTASCQFTHGGTLFPCEKVRPEYQAPELCGQGTWAEVADRRDEYTDAWSLNVLMFQLSMGCHPFDGAAVGGQDLPREERAESGLFPFHRGCREFRPPCNAPPYRHVGPDLKDLFFRCFVEGQKAKDPTLRPTAAEWADVLRHCTRLRDGLHPAAPAAYPAGHRALGASLVGGLLPVCFERISEAARLVSRHRWAAIASLAVLGATAGGSFYLGAHRGPGDSLLAPSSWIPPAVEGYDQSEVDVEDVLDRIRRKYYQETPR